MEHPQRASYILSIGMAATFIGMSILLYREPAAWAAWLPAWADGGLQLDRWMWLRLFAGMQLCIGCMLLVPYRELRRAGSVLAVFVLMGVMVQAYRHGGLGSDFVRSVGLFSGAVALSALL